MSTRRIYRFRLYIAGDTQNSAVALANLKALCAANGSQKCIIELVDVLRDAQRALADKIFITPTLVRLTPAPMKRVVGTLNHLEIVAAVLGLELSSHER
jgi:circadian clock protein KaiB